MNFICLTSNIPFGVILISGITGRLINDSVIKGWMLLDFVFFFNMGILNLHKKLFENEIMQIQLIPTCIFRERYIIHWLFG